MARLIKRYGSRKLYDTNESRYVSLDEIAGWIRDGEDIQVVDNASSEDVTAQTLTQIISEEGRKKHNLLSSDLLHDLIRAGETMVGAKVKQFHEGVEGFVKKSLDRLVPVSRMREEMKSLRGRLDELEDALAAAEEREVAETKSTTDETANNAPQQTAPEVEADKPAAPAKPKTTRTRKTTTRKTTVRSKSTAGATKKKAAAKPKAEAPESKSEE